MQAEIITIGDELLIGQVVDTNSAWLGRTLGEDGIKVTQITSIQDDADQISRTVNEALARVSIVLVTGGLGPTRDDITKHTLAELFGMRLVRDEQVYETVRRQLAVRGIAFNELNRGQALVPDGCTVLPNRNGTAPGMWFERGGKILVSMPGVPFEMKALVTDEVLPRLRTHFSLHANVHRTATTFGLAESILADRAVGSGAAREPALGLPAQRALHPAAAFGLRNRSGEGPQRDRPAIRPADRPHSALPGRIRRRHTRIGDRSLLRSRGETLATAESCTGGNIAHRFTAMPGASDYFLGGVVAYSNEVKTALLGVDPDSLNRYGAVSRSVAEQMAEGVRRATGATYGISTTGIAGPTGGTPGKPVGTVWMAVATPEGVHSRCMVFGSVRAQNIERSSSNCINLLRLQLLGFGEPPLSDNI